MFRLGLLRKPSSLIALSSLGLVAGHFLYQEYRRRYTAVGAYTAPNEDRIEPNTAQPELPNSEQGTDENIAPSQKGQLGADADADADAAPEDDDDSDDEPEDPTKEFQDVLGKLDLPRLASFATALRITQIIDTNAPRLGAEKVMETTCTISDRTFGSYNIAYEITFSDGLMWVARIPGHGFRFEDLDIQKMNSEYHTMRYIKKNADFPLPEVIHWSTSTDLIGVPFGIISAAEGHPLCNDWQDMTEEKRLTVLNDIAGHMSKLQQLSFDQIGSLTFSDDGTPLEVGPCLKLGSSGLPHVNANNELVLRYEAWPKLVAQGPWASSLEAYHDRIGELLDPEWTGRNDALVPLLRMLVETMPPELLNERCFYLNKPDLGLQNVFVNDDGKVTSFIDWDRVSCEDSMGGFATLPLWLCVDWNPNIYSHKPGLKSDEGYSDPSVQQLQSYRRHYSKAIAKTLEGNSTYDSRMTQLAFVAYAMETAIFDQWDRFPILKNFMSKAGVEFEFYEYNQDFRDGQAADKDAIVRTRFAEAWKAGWYDQDSITEENGSQDASEGKDSSEGSMIIVEPMDAEEGKQAMTGDD